MMVQFPFACPGCRGELQPENSDVLVCGTEGLRFELQDGLWRFLLPGRLNHYAQFIKEYETVRRGEARGADSAAYYRALPYQDLSGRMAVDWRIRAATFDAFRNKIFKPLESRFSRPLSILDLGAGNCWLSNHLAGRGHQVAAVDLTVNDFDGLGCHRFYDSKFTAIQAEFDHLPVQDDSIDLVIFNASLHYSEDYAVTLSEALRLLKLDGRLVILDTPIYHRVGSGSQMVSERQAEFTKRFGFPSSALKSENYLTYERIKMLGESLDLSWKFVRPDYGISWQLRPIKAKLFGRREPASFLIMLGQRHVSSLTRLDL